MEREIELLEEAFGEGRLDQAVSVANHLRGLGKGGELIANVAYARVEAARGNLERAVSELTRLTEMYPEVPLPLGHLAASLHAAGDHARAMELARQCYDMEGFVPAALVLLAEHAYAVGDHEHALELYEITLQGAPTMSNAWLGKARVLRDMEELADSEEAYIYAVEHGPERLEAWIEMIVLERDAGAIEIARENLAMAFSHHPAHPNLIALQRSFEGLEQTPLKEAMEEIRTRIYDGKATEALRYYEEIAGEYYDDPRLHILKAEVFVALGKGTNIPPLVNDLIRLAREEPNDWQLKTALGRLLLLDSPVQNPRTGAGYCESAWQMSGEHPHAGLGLVEAWAAIGKVALATALCRKLAEGEGPEARMASLILEGSPYNMVPEEEVF